MLQFFLSYFFFLLAKVFSFTYRFKYFGIKNLEDALSYSNTGSYCLATWHEHTIATILSQTGISYCALVSQSKDGDFVSFILKRLGHKTARGSSSRGGKNARQLVKKYLNNSFPAAFTVDGPRGPRHKSKPGIIKTAHETQTAILPVTTIAKSYWTLPKTWDQTKIPKPFSKVICQYGPIIKIPNDFEDKNLQNYLDILNNSLLQMEKSTHTNLKTWHKGHKNPKNLIHSYLKASFTKK